MPEQVAETKQRVPGLPDDYVEQNAKKAAKKKNKPAKKEDAPAAEPPAPKEEPKKVEAPAPTAADPEKRLKNVRKKLAEIEALEAKGKAGLSADQMKKIESKADFLAEQKILDKVVKGIASGMKASDAKEAALKATQKKGPAAAPVIPAAKPPGSPELPAAVPGGYPAAPAPKGKAEGKKKAAAPAPEPADATDAAKRLRNVKKKLAEIARLEENKAALSDEQKAKVARKKDFEAEARMLEKQVK